MTWLQKKIRGEMHLQQRRGPVPVGVRNPDVIVHGGPVFAWMAAPGSGRAAELLEAAAGPTLAYLRQFACAAVRQARHRTVAPEIAERYRLQPARNRSSAASALAGLCARSCRDPASAASDRAGRSSASSAASPPAMASPV